MNVVMTSPETGIRPRAARYSLIIAAVLAALVFYGCDTLLDDSETISLPPKSVTFRFEFSGEDVTAGQQVSVESINSVDMTAALDGDGYEKNEVVSAVVSSAVLRRVNPISFSLSSLSDFSLGLRGSTSGSTSVASLGTLPNGNSATLNLGTREVQSFVRQSSFSAVAQFTPGQLPDGDYVLTVTLELRIGVEDL